MPESASRAGLDPFTAGRFAALILAAVHREYPSHVTHYMAGDDDARPPRELTPAFFGSFDWHSAVHGHWALARLARGFPTTPFAVKIRAALLRSFAPENLADEVAYMSATGRAGFERPYGLAWLLQLCAELREWGGRDTADAPRQEHAAAAVWSDALAPLESLCAERLRAWLPKLPWPIRTGLHSQTALSLSLALDWTRASGDASLAALIRDRAGAWHADDADAPIAYEPSGHDFLSPVLGEADLMRRVLAPDRYLAWLDRFLPDLDRPATRRWLTPVTSPDPADGHLSHLDGLNLSRAWMLEGIASALPAGDPRGPLLLEAADTHGEAGLAAVRSEHYAGAHWLGTYAVYYLTRRGLGGAR